MRRYLLVLLIAAAGVVPIIVFHRYAPLKTQKQYCPLDLKDCQERLLSYLKTRKDKLAQQEAEKILAVEPDDICALWAKAEILRRAYKFEDAQKLLKQILAKDADHAPSLISLSYIRYHADKFSEALKILRGVLRRPDLGKEDEAMAYMLVGSINAKRASQGGIFGKLIYGTRIKGYFERAKEIAPDLPEVRLGLGTYCLLAPKIAGGDIDKAVQELEYAVKLAPDFATPKARLAQAYKDKGNMEKYNFYLKEARELDPENEVVREIEN